MNDLFKNDISKYLDKIILYGILFLCLTNRIWYHSITYPNIILFDSDSVTYFTKSVFVDLYRTPVYPLLIKIFSIISKENYLEYLIWFQQITSLFSIILFYDIARIIVKNRLLISVATIIFGCWDYFLDQNISINPESLAISGSTLIIWLFLKYIEKPNRSVVLFLFLFSFILILLKPIYLTLLPIILTFLIIRFFLFKDEKRVIIWGFFGCAITIIGIIGYCSLNYNFNRQFALTEVSLNNSLANVIISGSYIYGEDKEIIEIIEKSKHMGFYTSVYLINNSFIDNYKILNINFQKSIEKYNILKYNQIGQSEIDYVTKVPDEVNYPITRIKKFVKNSQLSSTYLKYIVKDRFLLMVYTYKILYSLLFCSFVYLFFSFLRKEKNNKWVLSFVCLFILSQLLTISISGIFHWNRLLIPSYPFIIIMYTHIIYIVISSMVTKFRKSKIISLDKTFFFH